MLAEATDHHIAHKLRQSCRGNGKESIKDLRLFLLQRTEKQWKIVK